jgi:uncharacterized protein YaiE (UPF0345 family)
MMRASFPQNRLKSNPQEVRSMDHNIYFDGKVQSLSLETDQGKATVGVISPGKYSFSTVSQERMVVTSGILGVKLPRGDWKMVGPNQEFIVEAKASFDVEASRDVSYICYYG